MPPKPHRVLLDRVSGYADEAAASDDADAADDADEAGGESSSGSSDIVLPVAWMPRNTFTALGPT